MHYRLALKVIPKAGQDRIDGLIETAYGQCLKIRVTAIPEDGKANKAVLKLLAKHWGVPKSALAIVSGETSRDKILEVTSHAEKIINWLEAQDMHSK